MKSLSHPNTMNKQPQRINGIIPDAAIRRTRAVAILGDLGPSAPQGLYQVRCSSFSLSSSVPVRCSSFSLSSSVPYALNTLKREQPTKSQGPLIAAFGLTCAVEVRCSSFSLSSSVPYALNTLKREQHTPAHKAEKSTLFKLQLVIERPSRPEYAEARTTYQISRPNHRGVRDNKLPSAESMQEQITARVHGIMRSLILLLPLLFVHQAPARDTPQSPVAGQPQTETHTQPQNAPPKPAAPPKPKIEPYPSIQQVEAAMKKAVSFFRTHLSFAGGYATRWSRDLRESSTSDTSGIAIISIEAPGTPVIGNTYLRAYQLTGDKLYLQAAREAAQALLWTQLASGGWATLHDYSLRAARTQHYRRDLDAGDTERGSRRAHSTLDDHKTQWALLFLLELAQLPESKHDSQLQQAVDFALDSLLAAQAPNGGWPQGFDGPADPQSPVKPASLPDQWSRTWPAEKYAHYDTINDGNLRSVARVLLRAHELKGDERCLTAVKKLGDFLLLAQLPEPQAGWAQQYNRDMQPAWARKFEPPAVSSVETLSALNTLHDIWLATGEDAYRKPFASALDWLEKSRLPDGQYARFQELHTNQPLYFVKDTYELTYDDSNLPTHYGFKSKDLQKDIDKFKHNMNRPRPQQAPKIQPPQTAKSALSDAKSLAKKVVTGLQYQNQEGVWTDKNQIEAILFVKTMTSFMNYLESARAAGPLFDALREQENAKDPNP
jgi:PelA/Pel-15E family pectate lyase